MRAALATRYATVRPFLALLGESKALDAASAGKRVLAGVRGLPALARRKVGVKPLLPREVDDKLVPPAWRKAVYANRDLPQGAVDRDAYVVCVLEQLHRALNNRDVFASPSHRWSNPRARLLDGPDWEAADEDVLAGLSLDMPVAEHLAELVRPGCRVEAARRTAGGGGAGGEGLHRGAGRRAGEAERRQARRARRAEAPDLAAQTGREDAPEDRPAGPFVRGERLDRVPRRLRAPRGRHPPG